MPQPEDLKTFKNDARKTIRLAHNAIRSAAPETPEQEHNYDAEIAKIWAQFSDRMIELIESAYATIPEGTAVGSQRSQIIEQGVKVLTENIIAYPGTPYTASNAQTLGEMLRSLEISKKIDREDAEETA